jgi:hypothetical protein
VDVARLHTAVGSADCTVVVSSFNFPLIALSSSFV